MDKKSEKKLELIKSLMVKHIKKLKGKELATYVTNGIEDMGFKSVSTEDSNVKIYKMNDVVIKVEY